MTTRRTARRWSRAGAALIALLAGIGCVATANRAPITAPEPLFRSFPLDFAHVPAPPADLSAAVRDAWLALRSGDATAAEQSLVTSGLAVRESAGGRTVQGFLALSRSIPAQARAHFLAALDATEQFPEALYGLGFLAEAEGNRTAALDWYGRAVAINPGMSAAAVRLRVLELEETQSLIVAGELAESRNDDAAALQAYSEASRLGPNVLEPYLRVATIYRRIGQPEEAVRSLRQARDRIGEFRVVLEPLGGALQETGAHAEAYDVFQALESISDNDPEVAAMVLAARELYFTTSLPEPYRRLEEKREIVREDLAALLAIRLPDLGDRVTEPATGIIITDIEESWAGPYIRQVVEWGVMQVFQNHGFAPDIVVKRQMFAEVAFQVLELLGATEGAPRAQLGDVSTDHYFYDQIRVVTGYEILPLGPRNTFGILDPVSGAEAVAAVQRLVRIARSVPD